MLLGTSGGAGDHEVTCGYPVLIASFTHGQVITQARQSSKMSRTACPAAKASSAAATAAPEASAAATQDARPMLTNMAATAAPGQ